MDDADVPVKLARPQTAQRSRWPTFEAEAFVKSHEREGLYDCCWRPQLQGLIECNLSSL